MESFDWFDELLANIHGHIERVGWSLMSVMGDRDNLPWTYTIGLIEKFDHPELVMIGAGDCCAGPVMNALGREVAEGRRFIGNQVFPVEDTLVMFRPVHERHWDCDLFAKWHHYYRALGCPPQPAALQVLWPDEGGCFPEQMHWDRSLDAYQPRLWEPSPPGVSARPSRARKRKR